VHVVDKDAFPGDMSADGAGLYFETVHGVTDDLAQASPTTSAVRYRKAPVGAPLALVGGRVDLLAFGSSAADGRTRTCSWSASAPDQVKRG
jgi:hypothetical protein